MNECKIVEDLIPLYAEDLTNEEATEFVKNHVEHCGHCRKLLERSRECVPPSEEDGKNYKKALLSNKINLVCKSIVMAMFVFAVIYFGATKWDAYVQWWNGKAPVEQVVKAPVGNGEVTLVDWEASGWKIGGTDNVGTILWTRQMQVRQDEYGTGYNISEGGSTEPWENVQVYWSPNGNHFLVTADLIAGGEGIFIHGYSHYYDEEGRHYSESKFLTSTKGNGLVDVLTALCEDHPDFPAGWETIEFTFHQWRSDSETIIFVYDTDNGYRGVLDYHFPTDTITAVN